MNTLANLIKVGGIRTADVVNRLFDPYEDFTRSFMPPANNARLYQKAAIFHADLITKFRRPDGLFHYNYGTEDIGDQAVHQGLTTAALAFGNSIQTLSAVLAMNKLFVNGRLIRGRHAVIEELYEDNPSNDSATGILCGAYFAWRYAGIVTPLIPMLADELIANDYCLVNQDGEVTKYGRLVNRYLTDPQRVSLALAIFKAAAVMTFEHRYTEHFKKLYVLYGALLPVAEFKFLDYTKTHEAHRCAIHLHILADLAGSNEVLYQRCVKGLKRIWTLHRKSRDPWIGALVNGFAPLPQTELSDVVARLHEYPVNGKPPCTETVNSNNHLWPFQGVKFIKVKGKIRSSQPLPYHVLPSQDFWPQRHPYMCDGHEGSTDPIVRHNAVDFLAPYYLLRRQGVIREDE